jgi:hypothetical protein
MNKNAISTLWLPALEIRQGPRRTLYTFAVDGKELANFATISRIGRTDEHTIKFMSSFPQPRPSCPLSCNAGVSRHISWIG